MDCDYVPILSSITRRIRTCFEPIPPKAVLQQWYAIVGQQEKIVPEYVRLNNKACVLAT